VEGIVQESLIVRDALLMLAFDLVSLEYVVDVPFGNNDKGEKKPNNREVGWGTVQNITVV